MSLESALEKIRVCHETGSTILDLRLHGLRTLPHEIGQLTALTYLDVSHNGLTALPPEIGQFTALTRLNVGENKLTALPPEIGQLTALTYLNVHHNKLTELPPEIGQLTALTDLNVDDNNLTALPPEIGQLTALARLNVGGNKLTALPPEIGQLTALARLNLGGNKLTALPPEIGQLTALTNLDVSHNGLTALPQSVLTELSGLTSFRANNNPLTEPPLRFVERGAEAVVRYLTFKERQRRGSWVWFGSRLSRHFHLRSKLAAIETAVMTVIVVVCAHMVWPEPVWAAAAVAPLLLLKTRASIALGTRRFASLMQRLGLKARERGVSGKSLPFRVLGLGIGSIVIKLATTPYCLLRNLNAALKAMPGNLREQCREIDLTCAPELIPGLERAYDRDPESTFLFTDLTRPYHRRSRWSSIDASYSWRTPTPQTLISAPLLAGFFATATVYRLYVKAAVVLYLPLMLIDVPDRARLRERTSADREPIRARSKMAIQSSVFGLALFGLLGLDARPEMQAAVTAWLDDRLLVVWQAASVSSWMPKSVLSLLFLQAVAYLAGVGSEGMARSARADTENRSPSAVAQRWVAIAHGCYLAHLIVTVALLVGIFTALAPNAILIAEELWKFLF